MSLHVCRNQIAKEIEIEHLMFLSHSFFLPSPPYLSASLPPSGSQRDHSPGAAGGGDEAAGEEEGEGEEQGRVHRGGHLVQDEDGCMGWQVYSMHLLNSVPSFSFSLSIYPSSL